MPSQISHIAFAQRFLEAHPEYDAGDFLSGTVFPDIRGLVVAEHRLTHPRTTTLRDVLGNESAWWAGYAFHNYVDLEWNRWIRQYRVEPTYDVWKPFSNAVKLLEDEVLYREVRDGRNLAARLWPVRAEELTFGIELRDVRHWHGVIASYLVAPPTQVVRHKLLLAQRNPASWLREVEGYLRYIEATPKWAKRVVEFRPGSE